MTPEFRYKPVDRSQVAHAKERRGFVPVPLDHAKPDGRTLEIFYRLLPAHGSSADDSSKPVIVVFNGGPGIASSAYRPLNFDYANPDSPKNGSFDRFKFLLRTHRILLADQRGTDGLSAPLDLDHPESDASQIARYFSSDSHARDYLAVIEAVIPRGAPFYIIAQSYGGMPGMQYLSLRNARRPNGIIFSCSALPNEDAIESMVERRREQLKLNHALKRAVPDIELKLKAATAHLAKEGLDPVRIHGLYTWLGKDVSGVWEPAFVARIEKLMKQSRADIESDAEKLGEVNLLNYILSSANFTPGHTDRTLARLSSERVPFEPWMVDENRILMLAGQDGSWRGAFVDGIDQNPPAATPFLSPEALRSAIAGHNLLFAAADNDAYVPADQYLKAVEHYNVKGSTQVMRLPGGHHAIFLKTGHEALLVWASQ